ncbi:pilus assembly PilX family protein [Chitiniphilus shinanonensis]|uniref:pilus assembly PilX family protein n=1 Tax=Chitiniphilus shinanonensis TaxID=553088 RepID=UPI003036F041
MTRHNRSQTGFILITSIIFMLVLTVVVVYAVRSATVYERVAGNNRNRSMAVQSAEFALRESQARLLSELYVAGNVANPVAKTITNSEYANFDDPAHWSDSNSHEVTGQITGIATRPRYVVRNENVSAEEGCSYYGVKSLGRGGSSTSVVVLDAVVKRCMR